MTIKSESTLNNRESIYLKSKYLRFLNTWIWVLLFILVITRLLLNCDSGCSTHLWAVAPTRPVITICSAVMQSSMPRQSDMLLVAGHRCVCVLSLDWNWVWINFTAAGWILCFVSLSPSSRIVVKPVYVVVVAHFMYAICSLTASWGCCKINFSLNVECDAACQMWHVSCATRCTLYYWAHSTFTESVCLSGIKPITFKGSGLKCVLFGIWASEIETR